MITSSTNVQMKNLIKLQKNARTRREQQAFVVEGKKIFEEAKLYGVVKQAYVTSAYLENLEEKPEAYFGKIPYTLVEEKILKEVADTMTPQGILAIVEKPIYSLDQLLAKDKANYVVLEDLRDPGNLGTIMRTAEGADMAGVVMSKETVDLFNPKVVRSTMGSIFRVPFVYVENIYEAVAQMQEAGVSIVATDLQGTHMYHEEKYGKKTGIVIGNEAKGISGQMRQQADVLVKIPMGGKLESLNASVAAGIMMYQLFISGAERF
ncbi:MAG: 23S rRNA (guanosine(2251)-2'-O)-methyltransferase RlmB [Lachnospiraceae bacterium]|nr:23S rRNA (guanosine(2251)-2'-O)-methyltransferase RlmB [Lachnospiraceae bacterium]